MFHLYSPSGMLRSRRLSPPVDMGDSSYYALTADAKQLAAVVIAGAGAGVLTGLSTYELALANAKQERSALLLKARDCEKNKEGSTDAIASVGPAAGAGAGGGVSAADMKMLALRTASHIEGRCDASYGNTVPTTIDDSPSSGGNKGDSDGSGDALTCTDMTALTVLGNQGMEVRKGIIGIDVDHGGKKKKEEEVEAEKKKEKEREKEIEERERENGVESPLEDMSKDQLKERILPYLAGDLFLIWRETDLATEKEKLRLRNRLLHIEEDLSGVSEEAKEERRRIDAMTYDERSEYEKDKREEVVYTMLQVKYGLDEEKITDDAERLRANSKGTCSVRTYERAVCCPCVSECICMCVRHLSFVICVFLMYTQWVIKFTLTKPINHSTLLILCYITLKLLPSCFITPYL